MLLKNLISLWKQIYKKYEYKPGQNLQHSPCTLNCSDGGHLSGGHVVSGSTRKQCILPSRHSHSKHSRRATRSPWSYITPRMKHCSATNLLITKILSTCINSLNFGVILKVISFSCCGKKRLSFLKLSIKMKQDEKFRINFIFMKV